MSKSIRFTLFLAILLLCLALLTACGGGSSSSQSQTSSSTPPPVVAVPSQPAEAFFGMQQSHTDACQQPADLEFPLFDARAGTFRIWSTCKSQWADMNPAQNTFDFNGLDGLLSALNTKGINDVYISLGSTPNWISSNPGDIYCDRANVNGELPGMCDPPTDLNPDGTGTDLAWRSFITALVSHVAASSYLANHAHITYYEIWSEFYRSDTVGVPGTTCSTPGTGVPCSYRGTFAQMLRMTQDLRCIVEGHPNDPITGLGTTCANANYAQIGVDPTAKIMEGDAGGGPLDDGNVTMQNYLYCNGNPPPQPSSQCNWSPSNPLGSNSTDVISGHSYFTRALPEDVMQFVAGEKALLSAADAAKPYFVGEGSWGPNPDVASPALQAAYVPRWYAVLLLAHADRAYWFAWDEFQETGVGGLWAPEQISFPPLQCTTPDTNVGGYYCSGGVAYNQTVNWLSGANVVTGTCPASCSNPVPGVFSLTIARSGGYQAEILWDSTAVSACTNPMCGSTPIPTAPSFPVAQWRDVTGATHSGMPPNIGASPIILENMAAPSS